MTLTFIATLGYVFWTLFLILLMEILRVIVTVKTGRAANNFSPDGSDVSPFAARLARAHANCYESFPIIGGALLLSIASAQHLITDPLALWLLTARVAQSCVHLASGSSLAAQIRFFFFLSQLAIVSWWLIKFVTQI